MPIQYRTMKDLKERTPAVLQAARRSDVVITLRGQPQALLRRITREELEILTVLQSRRVRRLLEQALQDVRDGRTVSLDALLERAAVVR